MKLARVLLAAVAGLVTAGVAQGQSFNIDFGTDATSPVPSAAHGAAAGQAGFWNLANSPAGGVTALNNLGGGATGVTLTNAPGNFNFFFNNAGTAGEFQNLMDDGYDLGGVGSADTFTISGLANGSYQVYTYAWAPDSATFITSVNVNGLGAQNVGGAWGGNYVQGITHSVHNVNVVAGVITIQTATVSGFSTINGIQIVAFDIPAPGALALMGVAGLAGRRRRRS